MPGAVIWGGAFADGRPALNYGLELRGPRVPGPRAPAGPIPELVAGVLGEPLARSHNQLGCHLQGASLIGGPGRSSQPGLKPPTGSPDFTGDLEKIATGPHQLIGELHRFERRGNLDRRPGRADRPEPRRQPVIEHQRVERLADPKRQIEAFANA